MTAGRCTAACQDCAAYSTELQIGKRFRKDPITSSLGLEPAEKLSFFGDKLSSVAKQGPKARGYNMKPLTAGQMPQGDNSMIQLHEAQSLLLLLAVLILSFLVLRLLRLGSSESDNQDKR
ncbi:hypothetical protein [Sedimentitalea sp.]|uniref:hypothetical protein n=1 Tax=Sedimentitalea sp. TaxID=2048915 RepID=UPI00329A218B